MAAWAFLKLTGFLRVPPFRCALCALTGMRCRSKSANTSSAWAEGRFQEEISKNIVATIEMTKIFQFLYGSSSLGEKPLSFETYGPLLPESYVRNRTEGLCVKTY
jgi:hypothetical protein